MYLIDAYGRNVETRDDAIERFEEAKSWLEEKGIRVSPTRFHKCKKLICAEAPNSIAEDFDILWAHAELHDICEIHRHLSSINSSSLTESLRKSVKGPELLANEKSDGGSIHGRNFTFELYTGARIARAGYEVTFETDSDINFFDQDVLLHVECKRVISESNMDKLILDAVKQIDKRCSGSINGRGIVAISISRLLFKALGAGANGSYADIDEMQTVMRQLVGKWSQVIQYHFSAKSDNVIGLLLHFKMPFRDQKTGAAAFLNRFSMISFENGYESNLIAHRLSSKFRQSIESRS